MKEINTTATDIPSEAAFPFLSKDHVRDFRLNQMPIDLLLTVWRIIVELVACN